MSRLDMRETTLYFVRHGETEYNRLRIMQGRRIDSSLNDTGRRQAVALAARFRDVPLDVIYTSSLKRTRETAGPLLAQREDIDVHSHAGLDEMSWGVHEGRPWTPELREMLDSMYRRWEEGDYAFRVEEGESILDVQERALDAVGHIVESHPGRSILVITHGRFLRVLLSTILEFGLERMNEIDHANTGVNVVTHCEGVYSSSLLNCTAHLDVVDSVLVE